MSKKGTNELYDFDLIITSEQMKRNRDITYKKLSNERKLIERNKKVFIISMLILLGAFIGISIYQLFTIKTTKNTPVGSYTCNGEIVQVCSGSKAVYNYLK